MLHSMKQVPYHAPSSGAPGRAARSISLSTAAFAGLLVMSACGSGEEPPQLDSEIDTSTIRAVPVGDVVTDQCIVGPTVTDGLVDVVDCPREGGARVVAVTTFGTDAPQQQPEAPIADGYANVACDPLIEEYVAENELPEAGPIYLYVYAIDEWTGPETPLLCGLRVL